MKLYYSNENKDIVKLSAASESLGGWKLHQSFAKTLISDFMPYDNKVYYRCIYAMNDSTFDYKNLFITSEVKEVDVQIGLILVKPNDCFMYYVEPITSQYDAPENVEFSTSASLRSQVELKVTKSLDYKETLIFVINGQQYTCQPFHTVNTSIEATVNWIVKNNSNNKEFTCYLGEPSIVGNEKIYDTVLFKSNNYTNSVNDLSFSSDGSFKATITQVTDAFDDRLSVAETFAAGEVLAIWLKIDYTKQLQPTCENMFKVWKSGLRTVPSFSLNFEWD